LTRRIWDIADEETRRSGHLASRKQVVDRAVAEGANYNTASTQYHHWRKHEAARAKAEPIIAATSRPLYVKLEIKDAGRVLLPGEVRAAMGVAEGDTLTGVVEDGVLRLMSLDTAVRQIQAMVRQRVPEGVSLVDELIAERRAENARESKR
jgi:bifunctional DNA-binding transcriptional regulator/antitoxin component of YhaV-PrlF toxin-antitoxin module